MKKILKLLFCIVNITFFILSFQFNTVAAMLDTTGQPAKYICPKFDGENGDKKVIYLTFDDGPSLLTEKVLDILKENNVKATFFVIGCQINGYEDTLIRMHKEGHSLGLHTYSHKYKRIYSSRNNFVKEMLDCQSEINRVVGVSPSIIRFPGGSQRHLDDSYVKKLHSNNFKIYDWNIDSLDSRSPRLPSSRVYRQSIKNNQNFTNIILLMHCDNSHKNSIKALPTIIDYYKERGYEFKPITDETPEYYFRRIKRTFNIFDPVYIG